MTPRRHFLQTASAGIVIGTALRNVASASETTGARAVPSTPWAQPKVVRPGEGTKVWAMGVLVTIKVHASDTNGAYSVFEDYVPPGSGPVPHTHSNEDETIFVLEGELRAWLDGQQHDIHAGDFVHMPRGVEHYFKNISKTPTRMLLTYTPGGFEQWFLDVGKPANTDALEPPPITPQDIELAVQQAQKYGVLFNKR